MKIYLLRHGETDWNREQRIQGQTDTALNADGIRQAEKCREYFARIRPEMVISSELERARHTAEIISGRKPLPDRDFNERFFGRWQGMLWADILRAHPELKDCSAADRVKFRPPGGETLEEMAARVRKGFRKILEYQCGSILIVAHGGPNRAVIAYAKGADNDRIIDIASQDNCCINIFRYEKTLEIEKINYVYSGMCIPDECSATDG